MPERPAYIAPAPPVPVPVAALPVPALRAPLNRPYLGQGARLYNNTMYQQQAQRAYNAGGAPRERDQNDISTCSITMTTPNNNGYNGYDANYMNVMYDEDDEMLAKAIQESLNDGLY